MQKKKNFLWFGFANNVKSRPERLLWMIERSSDFPPSRRPQSRLTNASIEGEKHMQRGRAKRQKSLGAIVEIYLYPRSWQSSSARRLERGNQVYAAVPYARRGPRAKCSFASTSRSSNQSGSRTGVTVDYSFEQSNVINIKSCPILCSLTIFYKKN